MIQGVVCLCSRGLVHSRTIKSLWRELPAEWELLTTDDLPIPDAQTTITEQALSLDPQFLWYVEEDMGLPEGILAAMMSAGEPVVPANYPLVWFHPELKRW